MDGLVFTVAVNRPSTKRDVEKELILGIVGGEQVFLFFFFFFGLHGLLIFASPS